MAEYIQTRKERQEVLKGVIRDLHAGKPVEEVKERFTRLLQDVGPGEIAELEQALIAEGLPEEEVKRLCDVHVAVFRESLEAQEAPETIPGHPVHTFRAENRAVEEILEALRAAVEALGEGADEERLARARERLQELRAYDKHYLRKENILFPYIERHGFPGPTQVMWAIHDDVRADWKALEGQLSAGPGDDFAGWCGQVKALFERLDTTIREMIYKEERILYPAAIERLTPQEWAEVRQQGPELGYSYVEAGDAWAPGTDVGDFVAPPEESEEVAAAPPTVGPGGVLELDVGNLTATQVNLLFKHLPVDITFVDKDDTVRFFSETERIFPRSPAIIGRQVQMCHPPGSVHRVQRVLDDFRAGTRDVAEFWIEMQGNFIHIRYFALRDEAGEYQGTLEVTQDVTQIRALEGERRLLDEEA